MQLGLGEEVGPASVTLQAGGRRSSRQSGDCWWWGAVCAFGATDLRVDRPVQVELPPQLLGQGSASRNSPHSVSQAVEDRQHQHRLAVRHVRGLSGSQPFGSPSIPRCTLASRVRYKFKLVSPASDPAALPGADLFPVHLSGNAKDARCVALAAVRYSTAARRPALGTRAPPPAPCQSRPRMSVRARCSCSHRRGGNASPAYRPAAGWRAATACWIYAACRVHALAWPCMTMCMTMGGHGPRTRLADAEGLDGPLWALESNIIELYTQVIIYTTLSQFTRNNIYLSKQCIFYFWRPNSSL